MSRAIKKGLWWWGGFPSILWYLGSQPNGLHLSSPLCPKWGVFFLAGPATKLHLQKLLPHLTATIVILSRNFIVQ